MTLSKRTLFFRVLLTLQVVVISYLAFAPVRGLPSSDKLSHVVAFLALSLVTDFSFPGRRFDLAKILPLLGYGLLIEAVQHYLPYRQFELLDIVGDAAGLLLYRLGQPLLRR